MNAKYIQLLMHCLYLATTWEMQLIAISQNFSKKFFRRKFQGFELTDEPRTPIS